MYFIYYNYKITPLTTVLVYFMCSMFLSIDFSVIVN